MIDQFEDMLGEPRKLRAAGLFPMINKPPRWNDQVGAYVLNFNGRVTMASVKNFQLIHPEDTERVVLQFGRVGKDKFTMDFMWPMTPMQGELYSFYFLLKCMCVLLVVYAAVLKSISAYSSCMYSLRFKYTFTLTTSKFSIWHLHIIL